MFNDATRSDYAGSTARYVIFYGDGPVFSEGDYETVLNNTAFNASATGYDIAVLAYQAAAGCGLGQAGKGGGGTGQRAFPYSRNGTTRSPKMSPSLPHILLVTLPAQSRSRTSHSRGISARICSVGIMPAQH